MENNDITQRAFWNLPNQGIIERHYASIMEILERKPTSEEFKEVSKKVLSNYNIHIDSGGDYQINYINSYDCEGIPGKMCLKGKDAAGEICKLCNGTGFKQLTEEEKAEKMLKNLVNEKQFQEIFRNSLKKVLKKETEHLFDENGFYKGNKNENKTTEGDQA